MLDLEPEMQTPDYQNMMFWQKLIWNYRFSFSK